MTLIFSNENRILFDVKIVDQSLELHYSSKICTECANLRFAKHRMCKSKICKAKQSNWLSLRKNDERSSCYTITPEKNQNQMVCKSKICKANLKGTKHALQVPMPVHAAQTKEGLKDSLTSPKGNPLRLIPFNLLKSLRLILASQKSKALFPYTRKIKIWNFAFGSSFLLVSITSILQRQEQDSWVFSFLRRQMPGLYQISQESSLESFENITSKYINREKLAYKSFYKARLCTFNPSSQSSYYNTPSFLRKNEMPLHHNAANPRVACPCFALKSKGGTTGNPPLTLQSKAKKETGCTSLLCFTGSVDAQEASLLLPSKTSFVTIPFEKRNQNQQINDLQMVLSSEKLVAKHVQLLRKNLRFLGQLLLKNINLYKDQLYIEYSESWNQQHIQNFTAVFSKYNSCARARASLQEKYRATARQLYSLPKKNALCVASATKVIAPKICNGGKNKYSEYKASARAMVPKDSFFPKKRSKPKALWVVQPCYQLHARIPPKSHSSQESLQFFNFIKTKLSKRYRFEAYKKRVNTENDSIPSKMSCSVVEKKKTNIKNVIHPPGNLLKKIFYEYGIFSIQNRALQASPQEGEPLYDLSIPLTQLAQLEKLTTLKDFSKRYRFKRYSISNDSRLKKYPISSKSVASKTVSTNLVPLFTNALGLSRRASLPYSAKRGHTQRTAMQVKEGAPYLQGHGKTHPLKKNKKGVAEERVYVLTKRLPIERVSNCVLYKQNSIGNRFMSGYQIPETKDLQLASKKKKEGFTFLNCKRIRTNLGSKQARQNSFYNYLQPCFSAMNNVYIKLPPSLPFYESKIRHLSICTKNGAVEGGNNVLWTDRDKLALNKTVASESDNLLARGLVQPCFSNNTTERRNARLPSLKTVKEMPYRQLALNCFQEVKPLFEQVNQENRISPYKFSFKESLFANYNDYLSWQKDTPAAISISPSLEEDEAIKNLWNEHVERETQSKQKANSLPTPSPFLPLDANKEDLPNDQSGYATDSHNSFSKGTPSEASQETPQTLNEEEDKKREITKFEWLLTVREAEQPVEERKEFQKLAYPNKKALLVKRLNENTFSSLRDSYFSTQNRNYFSSPFARHKTSPLKTVFDKKHLTSKVQNLLVKDRKDSFFGITNLFPKRLIAQDQKQINHQILQEQHDRRSIALFEQLKLKNVYPVMPSFYLDQEEKPPIFIEQLLSSGALNTLKNNEFEEQTFFSSSKQAQLQIEGLKEDLHEDLHEESHLLNKVKGENKRFISKRIAPRNREKSNKIEKPFVTDKRFGQGVNQSLQEKENQLPCKSNVQIEDSTKGEQSTEDLQSKAKQSTEGENLFAPCPNTLLNPVGSTGLRAQRTAKHGVGTSIRECNSELQNGTSCHETARHDKKNLSEAIKTKSFFCLSSRQHPIYTSNRRLRLRAAESSLSSQNNNPQSRIDDLNLSQSHRWWQKRRVASSLLGAPSKRYLVMPEIRSQDWRKIIEWQLKTYFLEEEKRLQPLVLERIATQKTDLSVNPSVIKQFVKGKGCPKAKESFKIKKIAIYLPWTTLKKSLKKPFEWPLTSLSYQSNSRLSQDLNTGQPLNVQQQEVLARGSYKSKSYTLQPIALQEKSIEYKERSFLQNKKSDSCFVSSISPQFKASSLSLFNQTLLDSNSTCRNLQTKITKKQLQKNHAYKPFLFEQVTKDSHLLIHQLLLAVAIRQLFQSLYKVFGKLILDRVKNSSLGIAFLPIFFNASSRSNQVAIFYALKKRFKDLVGSEDTISSLSEIVWYLRNSCRGRMVPRGVVLVETVSSESTDFLKAIGGEAQVPVIVQSLRALPFTQNHPQRRLEKILTFAQKKAPCILFLDDLDAIGESRTLLLKNNLNDRKGFYSEGKNAFPHSSFNLDNFYSSGKDSGDVKTGKSPICKSAFEKKKWKRYKNDFNQVLHAETHSDQNAKVFNSKQDKQFFFENDQAMFSSVITRKSLSQISHNSLLYKLISSNSSRKPLQKEGTRLFCTSKRKRFDATTSRSNESHASQTTERKTLFPVFSNTSTDNDGKRGVRDSSLTNKALNETEKIVEQRRVDLMLRLLTVMDGISHLNGVLIVTTSKNPSSLDPALLRPGRFERLINLKLPNKKRRIELLKVQTSKIGHTSPVPWEYFGTRTQDMTGTEIASAINHSAFRAIMQSTKHTVKTLEHGITSVNQEGVTLSPFASSKASFLPCKCQSCACRTANRTWFGSDPVFEKKRVPFCAFALRGKAKAHAQRTDQKRGLCKSSPLFRGSGKGRQHDYQKSRHQTVTNAIVSQLSFNQAGKGMVRGLLFIQQLGNKIERLKEESKALFNEQSANSSGAFEKMKSFSDAKGDFHSYNLVQTDFAQNSIRLFAGQASESLYLDSISRFKNKPFLFDQTDRLNQKQKKTGLKRKLVNVTFLPCTRKPALSTNLISKENRSLASSFKSLTSKGVERNERSKNRAQKRINPSTTKTVSTFLQQLLFLRSSFSHKEGLRAALLIDLMASSFTFCRKSKVKGCFTSPKKAQTLFLSNFKKNVQRKKKKQRKFKKDGDLLSSFLFFRKTVYLRVPLFANLKKSLTNVRGPIRVQEYNLRNYLLFDQNNEPDYFVSPYDKSESDLLWGGKIAETLKTLKRPSGNWYRLYLPKTEQNKSNREWLFPDTFFNQHISLLNVNALMQNPFLVHCKSPKKLCSLQKERDIEPPYYNLILTSFYIAFQSCTENRELLDLLADHLTRFKLLRLHEIMRISSFFLLNTL